MRLSIKTLTLQEMLAKSVKGASNNKMIPLTGLMAIVLKDNKLTLITSDATNYLYVQNRGLAGEDFYVVVQVDTFAKLISKMTSETVELSLEDDVLTVKGNGTYQIELPLDEEGRPITYPNPVKDFVTEGADTYEVKLSTIKSVLNSHKAALATTLEIPCYTGYYMGDNIVTTDTFKICGTSIKMFDKPVLISPEMMNLIDVMATEDLKVFINGKSIVITPSDCIDCIVYGKVLEGIEDYQIDAINGLLDTQFDSMCKLPKQAMLQLLDRLSLFVGQYDKSGVYMTFTSEGLKMSNKKSSGSELILYQDSQNFSPFTCLINIDMLSEQIKAIPSEVIELYYGLPNAIKIVDGNISQIIALLEDDRVN